MRTHVVCSSTAKPSFDLPQLLLKRLLERDAMQTIERLRAEIAARAGQVASQP